MTQEPTTTVVAETPAEPLPTPAAAEEAPAQAAAPEAPAEGEAPAEPQVGPFAQYMGENAGYEVLEHEAVKPILERRDRRLESQLTERITQQVQEAQRGREAETVERTLGTWLGRITQMAEDGDLTGSDKLLARVQEITDQYHPDTARRFRNEGLNSAAKQFGDLLTDALSSAPVKVQDEFDDLKSAGTPWPKLLDRWAELKYAPKVQSLQSKVDDLEKQNEQLKQGLREDKGPNGATTSSSQKSGPGIHSMVDADAAYSLGKISHDEYKAARERFGVK